MTPPLHWWIFFLCFIFVLLALDLGVFHRKAHVVKVREALGWSAVWISLGLLFNLGIYLGWCGAYAPAQRGPAALEFLTGYLVEYSLSVDNVFVFALLFRYFHIPPLHQHRVLFWGILGALVMRGTLIFAGIALLKQFHWVIYIFGAILILSGIKMWRASEGAVDPSSNKVLRFLRSTLPVTHELHGSKFFVRHAGKIAVTPLFIVLVFVEWTDLVFAVDSIPAVLAITHDAFIVFTSNVMAMLGLRSLYFALAGVMDKFHLLHYGLSALLVFIGTKMLLADYYKLPTVISLSVIAGVLLVSIVASVLTAPKEEVAEPGEAS